MNVCLIDISKECIRLFLQSLFDKCRFGPHFSTIFLPSDTEQHYVTKRTSVLGVLSLD